jgi:hypothetical protein
MASASDISINPSLMTIPTELRLQIFKYTMALQPTPDISKAIGFQPRVQAVMQSNATVLITLSSLLVTSKQLRSETIATLRSVARMAPFVYEDGLPDREIEEIFATLPSPTTVPSYLVPQLEVIFRSRMWGKSQKLLRWIISWMRFASLGIYSIDQQEDAKRLANIGGSKSERL